MHLGEVDVEYLRRAAGRDELLSTRQLYEAYTEHRRQVTTGYDREHRSEQTFSQELRRVTHTDENAIIKKARNKTRNGWRITRPAPASLAAVR